MSTPGDLPAVDEWPALMAEAFAEVANLATQPRNYLIPETPRRQYLFQRDDGICEVFTALPEYRDGQVTLTDIEDHRWIAKTQPVPHWADQIHDHCYGGDE